MISVTQEQIDRLLDASETQEHVFWEKELIVSYRLQNGFTISGRAACVDPSNFDLEKGRAIARKDAERQLWQLEGYVLQNQISYNFRGLGDLVADMIRKDGLRVEVKGFDLGEEISKLTPIKVQQMFEGGFNKKEEVDR